MLISVPELVDALARPVSWQRTNARVFVYAARVEGALWVLRLNGFPDHPTYTLFADGEVVGDVLDLQVTVPNDRPALTEAQREEVLTLMRGLAPYGSEVGQPCDGDWCCAHRTDEFAREPLGISDKAAQ